MVQGKETDAPIVRETSRSPIRDQDMSFLTKAELSQERIQEVVGWLPDRVQQLWESA